MESRSRASPEQFAALLKFMESHGDITRQQQGAQGRIKADRLWLDLVNKLNSIGGGVLKSVNKWKKVWVDWKAKTKKKALLIRREAGGTDGGPRSRNILTATEERILVIMGLTAVVGQDGIEERELNEPLSQIISLPPPARDSTHIELPSQFPAPAEIELDFISTDSIEAPTASSPQPSNVSGLPPSQVVIPLTDSAFTQIPSSPIASTSRGAPRRRQRPATPSPVPSHTYTPRRHRLLRARTRRVQTPFERATFEFVAVENRRLKLEEDRERNNHQRELERLRLETRRIEMEEIRNQIISRLAAVLENLTQILAQSRSLSLPSTDKIE